MIHAENERSFDAALRGMAYPLTAKQLRVTFVHPNGRREFEPVSKERLILSCLVPGVSISRLALVSLGS